MLQPWIARLGTERGTDLSGSARIQAGGSEAEAFESHPRRLIRRSSV
jgi:hypothetical protein